MRLIDPRLLRHASAARGYLILTVCLGLGTTALILVQASLLAHALAGAARGAGLGALRSTIVVLLLVLLARALMAFEGEAAALRAAAVVKSQLRRRLVARSLRLGPAWLTGQQPGEIATLATKGLDALDPYFARYLPQLVLSVLVPLAVLARVTAADWISGLVIAVTLPLIPLFAILVGLHTKARTQRQWYLLAALGGHFLDVVEGLPTLKIFGRAKAQAEIIRRGDRGAPVSDNGRAADRVPVGARARAGGRARYRAGRCGSGPTAARRSHRLRDSAARAPAHAGGLPATAGDRRAVPRQRRRHRRGRPGLRDPRGSSSGRHGQHTANQPAPGQRIRQP